MATIDTDDTLKLGHADALSAKAPARRFALTEGQEKDLLSPGIFAVLAVGVGAYLGRLREIVNPGPNQQPHEGPRPILPQVDGALSVQDGAVETFDIAAFWQQVQQRYREAIEQIDAPRRLYSSLRYNAQDFLFEGRYSDRPFQGVSIDLAANSFRFLAPTLAAPRFGDLFRSARDGGATAAPPGAMPGDPEGSGGQGLPPTDASGGGKKPPVDENTGGNGQPANRAPVSRGPVYLGSGLVNLSMLLMWADFARAATDPDGDRLSISDIRATSGEIRAYGSDAWIYVPERDKPGLVTLKFTISDGKSSIEGQAFLDLKPHDDREIRGTDGDDVLLGTPGKDVIDAGAGDDIVYGRESDDLIFGGEGDDLLIGGEGRDVIHGGRGHDRIFGGDGDDVLFGEDGDDLLFGEAGRDSLIGGDGDDVLSGGDGDDRLFGEAGDDVLSGDAGHDTLEGGAGDDTLAGGAGDDVVVGNDGDDVFVAGLQPVLQMRSFAAHGMGAAATVASDPPDTGAQAPVVDDGDDVVHGGDGNDTYDASFAATDVVIDLETGLASGAEIGEDRLTSIENAVGGSGDDTFVASAAVNVFCGNDGDDTFVFASVASIANGGMGFDAIRDFDVGDKVDLSKLERELGRLYFDDGEGSLALNDDDHKTLVKLYKKMIDDDDNGHHVLQLITDIDGDQDYEIVIISAQDLDADDLILTAFHLPGQTEGLVA